MRTIEVFHRATSLGLRFTNRIVEIEITHENETVSHERTRSAMRGSHPSAVHVGDSGDCATVYVAFLGFPDVEPATEWVGPVECRWLDSSIHLDYSAFRATVDRIR